MPDPEDTSPDDRTRAKSEHGSDDRAHAGAEEHGPTDRADAEPEQHLAHEPDDRSHAEPEDHDRAYPADHEELHADGLADHPRDAPSESDVPSPPADRLTLASAVRRHPVLVVLPALLLLAAGIAAGIAKKPTYSAIATINVGKSDISTQATPGYVQAAEALATTYSRLIASQHVSIPAAQILHESPDVVAANLSAVPILSQPTFVVTATAKSAAAAVRLNNVAVQALQAFVSQSQTQQGGAAQLLASYKQALTNANKLQQLRFTLQAKFDAHARGVTAGQVDQARVDSQVAALQAQVASNQYTSLLSTGSAPMLDVLVAATGATATDRTTQVEKLAVIGLIAGLVLGTALAALASGLGARRRSRAL